MHDKHQILADALDGMIHKGDGKIPPEIVPLVEIGLRLHNECPDADPAFIQRLGRTLDGKWMPAARPAWSTPELWHRLLRVGAAAAVVGALFLALTVRVPGLQAPVQAGLSRVITMFRHASVEQTPLLAATPLPAQATTYAGLEQAQAAVGFRIRVPSYLPQGLVLDDAEVRDVEGQLSAVLRYSDSSTELKQGPRIVMIQEFQSAESPDAQPLALQVGPESVKRLQVAGRPALWIQGHWGPAGRWLRGGEQGILMAQDGDVLILVAGRLAQAESVRIVESMLQ